MNHKLVFLILALGAVLLAGCYTTSFEGDYVVQAGDTQRGSIFATSGSVTLMEGSRVTGSVILTSGELRLGQNARVDGDVVMTSGSISMAEGSIIHGDVILSSRDIDIRQAPGSTIEGQVSYNIAPWAVSTGTKGLLLLCCVPLLILVGLFLLLGIGVGRSSRRKVGQEAAPVATVGSAPASVPVPTPPAAPDIVTGEDTQQKLRQLKAMLDEGLISEADYEAKKAEILGKM